MTITKRAKTVVKRLGATLLVATAMAGSLPASAVEVLDDAVSERPTTGAIILDAIVARPIGLLATVAGSAVFVVTLPFSILGGNVAEAADILVKNPAASTFKRCLGCTAVQDQTKAPIGEFASKDAP